MKLITLLLALTAGGLADRHFNPQHRWNAEAIDNIVFIHNKLRNAASHGLWERYNISKSSNMQLLSWNESLVAEAENEKYYCEPADNKNLPIKLGDNIVIGIHGSRSVPGVPGGETLGLHKYTTDAKDNNMRRISFEIIVSLMLIHLICCFL